MRATRTPFAMVPLWVYDHDAVTPTVLTVYLALAALTFDRSARCSVADLVARSGIQKSAVYKSIGVLESIGAAERGGRDSWFLPVDPVSAGAESSSATTESASAPADDTSSRELPREESARALPLVPRNAANDADAVARFDDHFWPTYPQRNGRRIGKAEALVQWCRLSIDEQRAALRGARHMAAEVAAGRTLPPDAHRWLRKRTWEDWQDPPAVGATNGRPDVVTRNAANAAEALRILNGRTA